MTAPSDPRAVVEFRVPAVDLQVGDLVNTAPGEGDWQRVLAVYRSPTDTALSEELTELVSSLDGRYVVVQLTDLLPVDGGVYFADGAALVAGEDEGTDQTVLEAASADDGERIYLYTKYELVTIRSVRV